MRDIAYKFATFWMIAALTAGPPMAEAQQQSGTQSAPVVVAPPAPTPAPAQQTPAQQAAHQPSAVLRSSSDLVRIDVEVTDKSGKPIKNLTANQFTVTDEGKPQAITSFSYADIEAIETATAADDKPIVVSVDNEGPNSPSADAISDALRDRRLIVLFFDLTSMQTDDLVRAHDAADKFVKQQMTKADVVAVVIFSTRINVLANFTNDRAVLNKAIALLTPDNSANLASPLYAAATNGEYDVQEYTGAAYTPDETEFNVFNTDQKLEAVEGLADVLGGIPGRKALVEFTGGITQTGEENRTELRAATDAANRADVSIYEIDARGLYADVPGGAVSSAGASGTSMYTGAAVFKQTDARMDSRDTLGTLSTDTGGRSFFDLGDLSEAFPKIEEENTGYYLVGYNLDANVKRDGSWHALRVKVNAPGVHVRSRDGFYAPRDFQHLEKEDRNQQ